MVINYVFGTITRFLVKIEWPQLQNHTCPGPYRYGFGVQRSDLLSLNSAALVQ